MKKPKLLKTLLMSTLTFLEKTHTIHWVIKLTTGNYSWFIAILNNIPINYLILLPLLISILIKVIITFVKNW